MLIPAIMPGVEETHTLAGWRIDTCKVGAFVQIAAVTSQREISNIIATAMLSGDDMLDVVS